MPETYQDSSHFPPTQWTKVQRAVTGGDTGAFEALSSLCQAYHGPLQVVIRARGYSPEDAKDLRQRFLLHLMARGRFDRALATGVRLRAFLLQELKGFLVDHYRYVTAAKRDERRNESLQDPDRHDPDEGLIDWNAPDLEYDRSWRKALVTQCMKALGDYWEERREAGRKLPPFAELGPLISYTTEETQRQVAERLGINENTLKTHLGEMRGELKKLIYRHVEQTLAKPTREAVEAEISALRLMN